ncbi:MAG: DNA-packaging protein [Puniceicoccales bacterium]|jgi:hypothetical protein|nr:DNA-packaging protein [Puniceicoccales bacterium]
MNSLDDFLALCDRLIADAEGAMGLILAPVEVLLANRFQISRKAVDAWEVENEGVANRLERIRLLQEEQIFKLLADGSLKDSTALLLLKSLCRIDGEKFSTLEERLDSLLGNLQGGDSNTESAAA